MYRFTLQFWFVALAALGCSYSFAQVASSPWQVAGNPRTEARQPGRVETLVESSHMTFPVFSRGHADRLRTLEPSLKIFAEKPWAPGYGISIDPPLPPREDQMAIASKFVQIGRDYVVAHRIIYDGYAFGAVRQREFTLEHYWLAPRDMEKISIIRTRHHPSQREKILLSSREALLLINAVDAEQRLAEGLESLLVIVPTLSDQKQTGRSAEQSTLQSQNPLSQHCRTVAVRLAAEKAERQRQTAIREQQRQEQLAKEREEERIRKQERIAREQEEWEREREYQRQQQQELAYAKRQAFQTLANGLADVSTTLNRPMPNYLAPRLPGVSPGYVPKPVSTPVAKPTPRVSQPVVKIPQSAPDLTSLVSVAKPPAPVARPQVKIPRPEPKTIHIDLSPDRYKTQQRYQQPAQPQKTAQPQKPAQPQKNYGAYDINNMPSNLAITIAWQNDRGRWYAAGPVQKILVSEKTQEAAMGYVWHPRTDSIRYLGVLGKYEIYSHDRALLDYEHNARRSMK